MDLVRWGSGESLGRVGGRKTLIKCFIWKKCIMVFKKLKKILLKKKIFSEHLLCLLLIIATDTTNGGSSRDSWKTVGYICSSITADWLRLGYFCKWRPLNMKVQTTLPSAIRNPWSHQRDSASYLSQCLLYLFQIALYLVYIFASFHSGNQIHSNWKNFQI